MSEGTERPSAPPVPSGWLTRRVVGQVQRGIERRRHRDDPDKRAWLVVLAVGAVALALVLAVRAAEGAPVLWGLAAASVGGAGALYAASFHGRSAPELVTQDGNRVRIRWRRLHPVSRSVLVVSSAGLWVVPAWQLDVHPAWWGALAVVSVLAVTSWIGAALTRAEVVLDPERLTVRSWFDEGSVAWGDIARTQSHTTPRAPSATAVVPFLDATDAVLRRRWWTLNPLRFARDRLVVHDIALDEPIRLRKMIAALARASPAERRRYVPYSAAPYLRREFDGLPAPPRPAWDDSEAVRRWLAEDAARDARPVPPW